ncbi:MAG: S24 family peptidase [Chakrabartia sp.]
MTDVQTTLDQLIKRNGDDYASLSRMLGRNPAYVQQFIRRGSPRKLDEADRATLARYFGVDESVLGAPSRTAQTTKKSVLAAMVMVPRLMVGASAGSGAHVDSETPLSRIGFEAQWLRSLGSDPAQLSVIQVAGDSMVPTLADGDDILVDKGDGAHRLRDGIYVLRRDDVLMVKRLGVNPAKRRLSIRSDNPAYPDWEDCDPATVSVIGRVIWVGRRMG